MEQEEFYVGYMPKAPKETGKFVRRIITALLIMVILAGVFIALKQGDFANARFEYGELTTMEGFLYKSPVPMLLVRAGTDATGKMKYRSVLLINYLKFGALPLLENLEKSSGNNLPVYAQVRGTLIYYDGKALLELTEGENAILEYKKTGHDFPQIKIEQLGNVSLAGEIVDSKCYFGAMNPGFGKLHRSCAVRCISGGIPPVLSVRNDQRLTQYFLLLDQNGAPINQRILPYLGQDANLRGSLEKRNDWLVLKININEVELIAQKQSSLPALTHHHEVDYCRNP